jgi:hypothetical protein
MKFWSKKPPPSAADPIEEKLGRDLLALDGGLGLFRLVHLLGAMRGPRESLD